MLLDLNSLLSSIKLSSISLLFIHFSGYCRLQSYSQWDSGQKQNRGLGEIVVDRECRPNSWVIATWDKNIFLSLHPTQMSHFLLRDAKCFPYQLFGSLIGKGGTVCPLLAISKQVGFLAFFKGYQQDSLNYKVLQSLFEHTWWISFNYSSCSYCLLMLALEWTSDLEGCRYWDLVLWCSIACHIQWSQRDQPAEGRRDVNKEFFLSVVFLSLRSVSVRFVLPRLSDLSVNLIQKSVRT